MNQSQAANPYASPAPTATQTEGHPVATAQIRRIMQQTQPWVLLAAMAGFVITGFIALFFVMTLQGSAGFSGGRPRQLVTIAIAGATHAVGSWLLLRYGMRIRQFVRRGGERELEAALVAQRDFWRLAGGLIAIVLALYVIALVFAFLAGLFFALF